MSAEYQTDELPSKLSEGIYNVRVNYTDYKGVRYSKEKQIVVANPVCDNFVTIAIDNTSITTDTVIDGQFTFSGGNENVKEYKWIVNDGNNVSEYVNETPMGQLDCGEYNVVVGVLTSSGRSYVGGTQLIVFAINWLDVKQLELGHTNSPILTPQEVPALQ